MISETCFNDKFNLKLGCLADKIRELPIILGGSQVISTILNEEC